MLCKLALIIRNFPTYLYFLLLWMVMMSTCAVARTSFSYGINAEYTDNASLSSSNEEEEVQTSTLAGFSWTENSAKLLADVNIMVDHTSYGDNIYSDDTWFYLNSEVTWIVRPSSFLWHIEDYYTRLARNVRLPDTPNNLINTNVFSTGPDLFFRLNSSNQLMVSGRITEYTFETITADSQRENITVSWLNNLSSETELSINFEYHNAEFEELPDADFYREDIFLRLDSQYSRSTLLIDLGASYVNKESGDDVDGFLTRLNFRRQFREQSFIQADMYLQYTDSGLDLSSGGSSGNELDLAGEQISGDIFYDKQFQLTYNLGSGISSYDMRAFVRDVDYEVILQDRRSKGIGLGHNYVVSELLQLNSFLQFNRYDYIDTNSIDNVLVGGLQINYRISREYTFRVNYNYIQQESDDSTSEYQENRVLLSFFYGRHPESYR